MSFFFFKTKPSLSFVFDIRDDSVSLAVARFEKSKKPELILCRKYSLSVQNIDNHKKYLDSMIKTLDKIIVSARKGLIRIGNREKIGKYYFFIGSPWSVSQAKTVKIIKDKPFVINNSVLEKIILGEETAIEKTIEEQTKEENWKVLEERVIEAKINGYKVDDVYYKKASNLAMEIFVSFIPSELKNKMINYVDQKIGRFTKRQNNSCALSSYSFLRDLYSNKNDFIYVDIGKFITDVYVVREDVIFGVASVPFGEDAIVEKSLADSKIPKEVFISQLNIGEDKNFDLLSHNNGKELLKPGIEEWQDKLKITLSKICTEMNIPSNLFIIPNSSISSIISKDISNKNKPLEILGTKIEATTIIEGVINNMTLNGKSFANQPYVKMDLLFLDKILKQ
jgi:hypothetical protein